MSKARDKHDIVEIIKDAALYYKNNLVGNQYLFVFDGRFIEVIFKTESFKHLTGVESPLSAKQFYKNAVNRTLTDNQVFFTQRHPYDLCIRKVIHLSSLASITTSSVIVLEDVSTSTQFYKFGATNLAFTLCLNNEIMNDGQSNSLFVPQSLRDEDCFKISTNAYEVTHIFSKKNDQKLYNTILFSGSDSIEVPDSILYLLAPDIT